MLRTTIPILEPLLDRHRGELGRDAVGYRNHVFRVSNLCLALASDSPDPTDVSAHRMEQVAIASAMHDIGIWTHGTFEYLEPSVDVARLVLEATGRSSWTPLVSAMSREQHELSPVDGAAEALMERFRRADLIDVSCGVFRFGLPRALLRTACTTWPSAGFTVSWSGAANDPKIDARQSGNRRAALRMQPGKSERQGARGARGPPTRRSRAIGAPNPARPRPHRFRPTAAARVSRGALCARLNR